MAESYVYAATLPAEIAGKLEGATGLSPLLVRFVSLDRIVVTFSAVLDDDEKARLDDYMRAKGYAFDHQETTDDGASQIVGGDAKSIQFGNTSTPVLGGAFFLDPGFGTRAAGTKEIGVPLGTGVLRNMRAQSNSPASVDAVLIVRVAGQNTALKLAIPAGASAGKNADGVAKILDGEVASVSGDSAGTSGLTDLVVTFDFAPSA